MKKSIFALSILSSLLATQAFAQISLSNDGYAFAGCSDQGTYNLCKFSSSGSGVSTSTSSMTNGIASSTSVQAGSSVTVTSSSAGTITRPQLTDSTSSAAYISGNSANNNNYSNTVYAYNTYYNGARTYKVVSCDEYNNTYYGSYSNYGTGSSMVNPNNRKGSQTSQFREDNGWASIEFFDPNTKKSLGWGGALIAKQEVWFNNVLDHYEGDSVSGTKYAMGQPNGGWNLVQQAGQCTYPFDPIYTDNGGGGGS